MSHPILATKLYMPSPRQDLVNRPRLSDRLTDGLGKKLTLISAPAGFGKTTLVVDWLSEIRERADLQTAWISLDEKDNLPSRFLSYLAAALKTVQSGLGQDTLRLLSTPGAEQAETALISLINDLCAHTGTLVLVLDDFQMIEDRETIDLVAFLIDNQPANLQIVLLTREDPILPLARLRAEDQLVELRAADLRFTYQESAFFLTKVMNLDIRPEELEALEERTEGWIVGLQLAGLSLQGQSDIPGQVKDFTGSNRLVLEYLVEEVLSKQDQEVSAFLLRTCLLESLTGGLCDALTGGNNGASTLERLEKANLFLVPLDSDRNWYRYHHLFRDLLLQRLHQDGRIRVRDLHRKASQWYREGNLLEAAVDHALLAEEYQLAGDLILQYLESALWIMRQNRLETWLSRIPEENVRTVSMLCILKAAVALNNGYTDQAARVLANCGFDFESYLQDGILQETALQRLAGEYRQLIGRGAVVKAHLVSFEGDNSLCRLYSSLALRLLPADDSIWRWYALDSLGGTDSGLDEERAYQTRSAAVEESKKTPYPSLTLLANLRLVVTLRDIGYLQQADQTLESSFRLAQENGLDQTPLAGWLHALWGELQAEQDQLDLALESARKGLNLASRGSDVIYVGSAYLCLLRVLFSRGETQDLRDTIQDVQHFNLSQDFSPWIMNQLAAWQARTWIQEGKAQAALNWLHGLQIDPGGDYQPTHDFDYGVIARLYTALNRTDEASQVLTALYQRAAQGKRTSKAIEVLILQALNAEAAGDRSGASRFLMEGLTLALPGGYCRTILDEGPRVIDLLRALDPGDDSLRRYVRELLGSLPASPTKAVHAFRQALVEPLTERELEVLQLIAAGNTNPEIADRLFLTNNTVKVHTRNIYGKMGVNNRTRAASLARELGLLAA